MSVDSSTKPRLSGKGLTMSRESRKSTSMRKRIIRHSWPLQLLRGRHRSRTHNMSRFSKTKRLRL